MSSMGRTVRSLGRVSLLVLCLAPSAQAQDARNAPTREDITMPIQEQLIVELYSR